MSALSSLGLNILPLLASAGVVGIAVGFGAQTLVRDLFSGASYLIEDVFRIGDYAAHVMRVTETAHWLEWQDWANPILQTPYEVKDGKLHIPDVPGIGLEWDEKAVAAHLVDNF